MKKPQKQKYGKILVVLGIALLALGFGASQFSTVALQQGKTDYYLGDPISIHLEAISDGPCNTPYLMANFVDVSVSPWSLTKRYTFPVYKLTYPIGTKFSRSASAVISSPLAEGKRYKIIAWYQCMDAGNMRQIDTMSYIHINILLKPVPTTLPPTTTQPPTTQPPTTSPPTTTPPTSPPPTCDSKPSSPCAEATWQDYPACSWDITKCEVKCTKDNTMPCPDNSTIITEKCDLQTGKLTQTGNKCQLGDTCKVDRDCSGDQVCLIEKGKTSGNCVVQKSDDNLKIYKDALKGNRLILEVAGGAVFLAGLALLFL